MIKVFIPHPLADMPSLGLTTHLANIFSRMPPDEVECYCFLPKRFEKGSIRVISDKKGNIFTWLPSAVRMMRKVKPDILLGDGWPLELLFFFLRPRKTKYVIAWHGPFSLSWSLAGRSRFSLFSLRVVFGFPIGYFLLTRAELILCDSEYCRFSIAKSFPSKRIVVTGNGVDGDFFTPAKRNKEWLRRRFQIPAQKAVAVFAGALVRRKRPDLVALLARKLPDVEFVIVGRNYCFASKDIKEWQERAPNLHWIPLLDRDEISRLFASADIFVFPSIDEAFGLVTVEAMASGLPVVATKSGATSEIVRDGQTGFLIAPDLRETEEFILKIKQLCADEKLWHAMSKSSRILARELFCWEKVASAYHKALKL